MDRLLGIIETRNMYRVWNIIQKTGGVKRYSDIVVIEWVKRRMADER